MKSWIKKFKYVWIVACMLFACIAVYVAGCMLCFWTPPSRYYLVTAIARELQGEDKAAIGECDKAIRLNPHDGIAYTLRASLRGKAGDMKGVISDSNAAIDIDARDGFAYFVRAKAFETLRYDERAMLDIDKAIDLDPKNEAAFTMRCDLRDWSGDKKGALADAEQAIALNPKQAFDYILRGKLRLDFGDGKGAIDDLDQATKLDPSDPWAFAFRGRARSFTGDKSGAIKDFSQAERIDPKYASKYRGRGFPDSASNAQANLLSENSSKKILTKSDLAHGEEQVRRMTSDRPRMAKCVSKGDQIWTWTVRQFAGEGLGTRIFWTKDAPTDAPSDNFGPYERVPFGRIRIQETDAKGKPLSGEEQWSCAVFEMYNIRGTPDFNETHRLALAGKLTKEAYIRRMTMVEFKAGLRLSDFYRKTWLPYALKKNLTATDRFWKAEEATTFEDWLAAYTDPSSYPNSVYGIYYDRTIIPYVKAYNAWAKAARKNGFKGG